MKYFGTFLIVTGGYAAYPADAAWCVHIHALVLGTRTLASPSHASAVGLRTTSPVITSGLWALPAK